MSRISSVLGLAAILAAATASAILVRQHPLAENVEHQARELRSGGLVLIAALYVPACILFVPGWPLSVVAGSLYGVVPGTVAVSIGSTAGACAAFWTGRLLARNWVAARIRGSPRMQALDRAVAEQGFLVVLLTRLSPAFPFNFLNYACGLTRVRFRDYLLASWMGMLPGTMLYVYLGSTASSVAGFLSGDGAPTLAEWLLLAAGLAATVAVTLVVGRLANRHLSSRIDDHAPDSPQ